MEFDSLAVTIGDLLAFALGISTVSSTPLPTDQQILSPWRFILTAGVLDSLFCTLASARMPQDVKEQLN